jgi:hypothetical protein
MTASKRHHLAIPALDIRSLESNWTSSLLPHFFAIYDVSFDAHSVSFTRFTIMMTRAVWAGSERRILSFRVSSAKSHCTLERRTIQLHCLLNMYACRWVNVLYMVWKILSLDWWPRRELIRHSKESTKADFGTIHTWRAAVLVPLLLAQGILLISQTCRDISCLQFRHRYTNLDGSRSSRR